MSGQPTDPSPELEHDAIDLVKARLRGRYPDLAPDRIGAAVEAAYGRYAHSRVRAFAPVLVEHEANERLAARRGVPPPGTRSGTVALDGDPEGT